jgi:hypothetical protein
VPETVTSAGEVVSWDKARNDTLHECPVIAGLHSFMSFVLPPACTGHLEDDADKINLKNPI